MQPECHGTTDSHADQASLVRGCTTATHKSCETVRRRCIYVQFLVYSMQLHCYTPDPKLQTKLKIDQCDQNGTLDVTPSDELRSLLRILGGPSADLSLANDDT